MKKKIALFLENLKIALDSLKGQKLRAILTALIIGIGITALVGILTATTAIQESITGNFTQMGANTFTIQNAGMNIQIGRRGERPKVHPAIKLDQAQNFKERFQYQDAVVSISKLFSGIAKLKYENIITDPNTQVWGIDENYLLTAGYEIEEGRNITQADFDDARPVAIIGQDIKEKFFPSGIPDDAIISVNGHRFSVIGLMAEKGSSSIFSGDRAIFIPLTKGRTIFTETNESYALNVMASSGSNIDATIGEATAAMRAVRKLKPMEDDNFNITRSDNIAEMLLSNLSTVNVGSGLIGVITLFGASIALMNIMLVSVTERTREIGTRKALGAKSKAILSQFLIEAILVSQMGGLIGIVLGIGVGNIVSTLIGGSFIIPWNWILLALFLCIIVGIVSGIYPAMKAAKQDPIEALRHE